VAGRRPDRAATVYSRILKELFPHTPVVLGGIEASLRRLTHYDYWDDALRPSILVDSGADIVAYGMGDESMIEIARALRGGFRACFDFATEGIFASDRGIFATVEGGVGCPTAREAGAKSTGSEVKSPRGVNSKQALNMKLLRRLPQVAFLADRAYIERLDAAQTLMLHSFEDCVADRRKFADNFVRIETESNLLHQTRTIVEPLSGTMPGEGRGVAEKRTKREYGSNTFQLSVGRMERALSGSVTPPEADEKFVVINPPYPVMTSATLDRSFELPYERMPHPRYNGRGDIPAWEMIKNSVNIHRGCFGGCSFCTISAHQGKFVTSRSEASVLGEVERVASMPYFKGYLSDLGGPSANMYGMAGRDGAKCGVCRRPSCLTPRLCPNLDNSHSRLVELYRRVRGVRGVKKAFVGSGIRYDLFPDSSLRGGTAVPTRQSSKQMDCFGQSPRNDGNGCVDYLKEIIVNHTSGRLKVAPEHTEEHVLKLMRKPPWESFERLNADFRRVCEAEGLKTQLIPYFISSHPGCTEGDMRRLSEKTRRLHLHTEQVQDLTPTPMTLASVMFYTGEDPYTGTPLYVARSQDDKRRQKSWFFRK
jgi:radical SAM superfamily enzyme YgiQ (UPF0313 family)